MRILLDTHPLIWSLRNDPTLSGEARKIINNIDDNQVYISVASIWEISIKQSIGKLSNIPEDFYNVILSLPIKLLPITGEHAYRVRYLPQYHKDPFDRLLISQSQIENLTLVIRDQHIMKYDISILIA